MGYTHYFRQKKSISDKKWDAIKSDISILFNSLRTLSEEINLYSDALDKHIDDPEDLFYFDYNSGETMINFNGDPDEGLDHETFVVVKDKDPYESFNFCKTNRKPYDAFVVSSLIIICHHAPNSYEMSSDGDLEDLEWIKGLNLLSNAFPRRNFKIPVSLKDLNGLRKDGVIQAIPLKSADEISAKQIIKEAPGIQIESLYF